MAMIQRMKLRSWSEFLELKSMKFPEINEEDKVINRIQTNLLYYQMNYLIILLIFLFYVCIARPIFILGIILVGIGGYYLFIMRVQPIILNDVTVPRQQLAMGYVAISVFIIILVGGNAVVIAVCLSTLIIVIHAAFRKRSIKSRSSNFVEMGKTPMGAAIQSLDELDDEDPEDPSNNFKKKQRDSQRQERASFRAQMRAKYLRNN